MDGGLDPAAILADMGLERVASIEQATGGLDTALWRVASADGLYALRVFRPEQAGMERWETLAMEAARGGGVPVPTVYRATVWRGRPALLLSWCPGTPLLRELRTHPGRIFRLGAAFGATQSRIHAVRAPEELRADPEAWIRLAGQEEALQGRLRAVSQGTDRLLHLDYHPLNVLSDGNQITAVLDWANALAGDPRADLARTVVILRLAAIDASVRTRALRRLVEYAWWRGYRSAAGPVRDMPLFYAWAGASMITDLTPKLGQRAGLEPHHLDPVRHWLAVWKRRAGV